MKCVESISHKSGLQIQTLVTDRHPQVVKFVRENMKETELVFDVWHVSKGKYCCLIDQV